MRRQVLTSAPGTRTSNLVAYPGASGGPRIRIEAARESYPYEARLGAQNACEYEDNDQFR